jgi:hypothetical protein
MLENIPKALLIGFVAVILFGTLAGARYVFAPQERGRIKPGFAYDQLALALDANGLGLLAAEPAAEAALIKAANTRAHVFSGTDADGNPTIALSDTLVCHLSDGIVTSLTLNPQRWRELRDCPLRTALLTVARIPQKRQAGTEKGDGGLPVIRDNFTYSASVSAIIYTFTPHFTGEACTDIQVAIGQAATP